MKKVFSLALAAFLMLTLSVAAFAAPSPTTTTNTVDGISDVTAVDANSTSVAIAINKIEDVTITPEDQAVLNSFNTTDGLQYTLGDLYVEGMKPAVMFDGSVVGNGTVTFPINIRLTLDFYLSEASHTVVSHIVKGAVENVEWRRIDGGTIELENLTSLSPFVIVTDADTTVAFNPDITASEDETKSPQTADNMVVYVAASLICIGVAVVTKKLARV